MDEFCGIETEFDLANRFQNQNLLVKAYRWLCWKPYYTVRAVVWLVGNCYRESKEDLHIGWIFWMAQADLKMNHWFTMEEVFNDVDLGDME